MGKCAALRCPSNAKNCKQFRFPRDPERRRKWIAACRRDFTPNSSSFLCDKHFEYNSFENRRADGLRKLKPNAVPSIFDFPEPVSEIKSDRKWNYERIVQQVDEMNSNENQVKSIIQERFKNSREGVDSVIGEDDRVGRIENLELVENDEFDNVCRICGGNQSELMHIFEDDGLEHDLPSKIRKHFYTVDITNWRKSARICYQCVSMLNSWNELFTQCETVNRESGLLVPVAEDGENQNVDICEPNSNPDINLDVDNEKETNTRSLLDFIRVVPAVDDDVIERSSSDGDSSLCGNAPSITADNPADFRYNWSPPGSTTKSVKKPVTQPTTKKKKKYNSNPNMLPPVCHICHKTFSCTLTKRLHLRSVHMEERPFLCHICDRAFKRRDYLNNHIRYVHDKTAGPKNKYQKPILCPDCGKILTNRISYEAHVENMHGKRIREYECNFCERTFGSYTTYYNHRIKHHTGTMNQNRKNFSKSCPCCFLEFENEYYYIKHMCRHEEIVECEMCEIKFDTHADFSKHVEEKHIGEKTLECATCGKKFSAKTTLKSHIMTHMNNKRHECSYCNWKFMKKSQLKIHMYRHTGEHPYTCDFCGRGFRQKSDFKRHRAAHLQKEKKEAEIASSVIVEESVEVITV